MDIDNIATTYRNAATGDVWTGRGPRPRWRRKALEAGATLEDFLVSDQPWPAIGDPLRAFQDAARRAHVTRKA
ncbi:MAG TPA: H-NS family nucleoid-associated regulatory protein [Pseudorhodoferax sp.]|nr:H-NS family nucleoid-associated regulatory protein [Pseudorhodoferax sp.]